MIKPNNETLDASTKYSKDLSDYTHSVWVDKELYKIVKDLNSSMHDDGTYEKLTNEQKKYVKSVLVSFVNAGILLSPETEKLI